MSSRAASLIAVVAMALAFALGFGLRRAGSGQKHESRSAPPPAPPATTDAAASPTGLPEVTTGDPEKLFDLATERSEDGDLLGAAIAFYQWLELTSADGIAAKIELADDSPLPEIAWDIAVFRWAELDPDSLIAAFGDDDYVLSTIFLARLRADPEGTLASCSPEQAADCRQYIAARHPEFDLDWARSFGVPLDWFVRIWLQRDADPTPLFGSIGDLEPEIAKVILSDAAGRRDPDRIAALLDRLEDDPQLLDLAREAILDDLGNRLIEPLASLKILYRFGLEFPADAQVKIYHYYENAMSETPAAMIEWLLELSPEERKGPLRTLFGNSRSGRWNENGWLELYACVPREELPELSLFTNPVRAMISQDPIATLDWLERIQAAEHFVPGDRHAEAQLLASATQLGARIALDGTEPALDTARQIQDTDLRSAVLAGIVEHLGRLDTGDARELLAELDGELSPTARSGVERKIVQQEVRDVFRDHPFDVGLEQLGAVTDESLRAEIARAVLYDPQIPHAERARLIDQHPGANPLKQVTSFTRSWAMTAPEEAAAWVLPLADHPSFPDHVDTLIENWAKQDVNAAGTWLQQIDSVPALDAAKVKIATRVSGIEPHTALEWAASISDPERRANSLRQAIIAIDTYASEAGEAPDAIAKLDISETERAMLLEHLEN